MVVYHYIIINFKLIEFSLLYNTPVFASPLDFSIHISITISIVRTSYLG